MQSAGDLLAELERLPLLDFDALRLRGLVVVAPHPDDESLGCGGLIAAARGRGLPVRIVILSDGTGSHPNSPSYPALRLRDLRESEVRAAAAELGVSRDDVLCQRLPDRFIPTAGIGANAAIATIVEAAKAIDANIMTVTWYLDPHADHVVASALARAACRQLPQTQLLAYPIWAFALPLDRRVAAPIPQGFRLAIDHELAAKRRAIACHRSQTTRMIADDPKAFMLGPSDLARFDRPFETFITVSP